MSETTNSPNVTNTFKISYKQLYKDQKKKNKNLQAEIETLKLIILSKEKEIIQIKSESLSFINSQTAKNGYKEEELVCKDLLND